MAAATENTVIQNSMLTGKASSDGVRSPGRKHTFLVRREATFATGRGAKTCHNRGRTFPSSGDGNCHNSGHMLEKSRTMEVIRTKGFGSKHAPYSFRTCALPLLADGGGCYSYYHREPGGTLPGPLGHSVYKVPFSVKDGRPPRLSEELNKMIVTHLRTSLLARNEKRVTRMPPIELNAGTIMEDDRSDSSESCTDFCDVIHHPHDAICRLHENTSKPGSETLPLPKLSQHGMVQLPNGSLAREPEDVAHSSPMEHGLVSKHKDAPPVESTPLEAKRDTESAKATVVQASSEIDQATASNSTTRLALLPRVSLRRSSPVRFDVPEVDRAISAVSPVPTPNVSRPETRYGTKLPYEEKLKRILRGGMDCRVAVSSQVMRIFVHSAGTDTEIERTALIQHAYPTLRAYALARGFVLQMVDLRWGTHNHVTDNQSDVEFSCRLLGLCRDKDEGLSFVTFVSRKHGEAVLPASIPSAEFEAILSRMDEAHEEQAQAIKLQLQARDDATSSDCDTQKQVPVMQVESEPFHEVNDDETIAATSLRNMRRTATNVAKEVLTLKAMKSGFGSHEHAEPLMLRNWYQLDENATPAAYSLKKISGHFGDLFSNDVSRRAEARRSWAATSSRMQKMLYHYAQQVFSDASTLRKYNISLCELELEEALLNSCQKKDETIAWFHRHLVDAERSDGAAADYFDEPGKKGTFDSKLEGKILQTQHRHYTVHWKPGGINTTHREHALYLERLCGDITDVVKSAIDQAVQREANRMTKHQSLFKEVNVHLEACRSKCLMFHGRKDLLQTIKEYVRSDSSKVLVVHGKAGCGKTSLVAKAAKEARRWLKGGQPATVLRMIGATASSTNVRLLLRSLCLQMCEIFNNDASDIPYDYQSLVNVFTCKLSQATESTPLLLFLESLHKLTDENDGRKMIWLPRELPSHVKMIVSCLEEDKYNTFKHLKKAFPGENLTNFLPVNPLRLMDVITILEHWYNQVNRKVTDEQFDVIVDATAKCGQPLYLRVLFKESLQWPSWLKPCQIKLGATVESVAVVIFGRLEKNYGEPLVRRALGYLTAARNGLTETEMEDLLSLDEAVMDDVLNHSTPPLRRLPVMYWLRIREELGEFVEETVSDCSVTLRWTHIHFGEAAEERYLNQKDKAPSYHKAMAEYFLNTWYRVPKPCGLSGKADRHITSQPLIRERSKEEFVYNHRKLNELPYHLLQSQQMDILKSECLCNFEFLLAKLSATSLRALFEDMHAALLEDPGDHELKMLSDTLHLSATTLTNDSRQLGSQIAGRLQDLVNKDQPIAPGDPVKYPFLKQLLAQAKRSSVPALIPSVTCLSQPGGILFDLLSGHLEPITAVAMTTDGQRVVTSSKDNTVKIWEVRTGRVIKTLDDVGKDVVELCVGANNSKIITSEAGGLRVWSMHTGDHIHSTDVYLDPASLTTADDSQLLVAFFHGSNTMRVWSLDGHFRLLQEVPLGEATLKDQSIIVSPYSMGQQVLYAFKNSSVACVRNASTGKSVHRLQCKDSGCVTALASNPDYFICAVRYRYMKLYEIYQLELFDAHNGQHMRGVRGCISDNVDRLFVNQLGSHALALCYSEARNVTDISVWNIETEDHRHVAKHAKVSPLGVCVDLRYVLTAARDENSLRIWNISGKVHQPVRKEKSVKGTAEIVPMRNNPRYVVAKSLCNGPLTVWNVAKGKCSGSAVRIERGLMDPSDVLLVRNTKVVVLTDRNFPDVNSRSGRPVFRKVLIYELRQKRYLHKISGCFIVPCPEHEYALLDDDHLLGFSESRSQFVVWSLKSGQIAYRMKPSFRQREKKTSGFGSSNRENSTSRRTHVMARMTSHDRGVIDSCAYTLGGGTRQEDLRKEKDNAIEKYIISEDYTTLVASFYAHHLCVFDIKSRSHTRTLENPTSMLFLHVAALTCNGRYLAHANYDDNARTSYVTLWDCTSGRVRKRLRNERDVSVVAVGTNAACVVFGKASNKELRVWYPGGEAPVLRMRAYPGLRFDVRSQIHIVENDTRAVVFAGDISLWDLQAGCLLAVFTPDTRITSFTVAMKGTVVVFGLPDRSQLVMLKLMSRDLAAIQTLGEDMFGEASSSSESEHEEEGEEEGEEMEKT